MLFLSYLKFDIWIHPWPGCAIGTRMTANASLPSAVLGVILRQPCHLRFENPKGAGLVNMNPMCPYFMYFKLNKGLVVIMEGGATMIIIYNNGGGSFI